MAIPQGYALPPLNLLHPAQLLLQPWPGTALYKPLCAAQPQSWSLPPSDTSAMLCYFSSSISSSRAACQSRSSQSHFCQAPHHAPHPVLLLGHQHQNVVLQLEKSLCLRWVLLMRIWFRKTKNTKLTIHETTPLLLVSVMQKCCIYVGTLEHWKLSNTNFCSHLGDLEYYNLFITGFWFYLGSLEH